MRFPSLSDLDREQRRVYAEAPNDGAITVIGAPGTGKTIMAFHRARKALELGQIPQVIMFNSVLMKYASGGPEQINGVGVSTMHKWGRQWWLGAMRKWMPTDPVDHYQIDWKQVCATALPQITAGNGSKFDWGHLIIDEGQDFPEDMYMALGLIASALSRHGHHARITVFADDNQRLQIDANSETAAIRKNLFIEGAEDRNFTLRRNFRNTREIAGMAAHFQVGNVSGQAELPERRGEVPTVIFTANDRDLTDFIARKVKASPGRQTGVIVHGPKSTVTRAYNQIKTRIEGTKLKVQVYISGDKNRTADMLDFDSPDTITVLHERSAKGLEFDIVFFLGLERIDLDGSGGLNERMALYVMSSRAREELFLAAADLDPAHDLPAGIALLPPPDAGLCAYAGLGSIDGHTERLLEHVEWIEPRRILEGVAA